MASSSQALSSLRIPLLVEEEPEHRSDSFPERSLLSAYINRYVIEGEKIPCSKARRATKNSLYTIAAPVSLISRFPYAPIVFRLARRIATPPAVPLVGSLLSIGTIGSSASFVFHVCSEIISDALEPISEEEMRFSGRDPHTNAKKAISLTVSSVLGLTSIFPGSFAAYNLNGDDLPILFLVIGSDGWGQVRSVQLSLEYLRKLKRDSEIAKKLSEFRNKVAEVIEESTSLLASSSKKKRKLLGEIIKEIKGSRENGKPALLLRRVESIYQKDKKISAPPSIWKRMAYKVASFASFALAAIKSVFSSWLGYFGVNQFTGNEEASIIAGCFIGLISMALSLRNLSHTSRGLVDQFSRCCGNRKNPSISKRLYPKLSTALDLLGKIIAILSFGGAFEVFFAYIYPINESLGLGGGITLAVGSVMIVSMAISYVVDNFLALALSSCGNQEFKTLYAIQKKLLRLSRLIRRSPLLEFAKFSQDLPPELYERICSEIDITTDKITSFVEKRERNLGSSSTSRRGMVELLEAREEEREHSV